MKRIRRYFFFLEDGESHFLKRRVSSYPGSTQRNYFIHSNAGVSLWFVRCSLCPASVHFYLAAIDYVFRSSFKSWSFIHYIIPLNLWAFDGYRHLPVLCVTLSYFCSSPITPVNQHPRSCLFFGSSVKGMFHSNLWCTWLPSRYPHAF
jgi:hypothetical protein